MKRVLATMLVVAVAGCGQQSPEKTPGPPSPQSAQPAATQTPQTPFVIRPLGTTGSDWRVIGASGKRPHRQIEMIDLKSLVISGDTRRIWMARVSEGAGDISYDLILNEYDCSKRTSKVITIAGTLRDGSLSTSEGSEKISEIIPGTMGVMHLGYACGTLDAKTKFPAGADPVLMIRDDLRKFHKGELIVAVLDTMKEQNISTDKNITPLLLRIYEAAASNSGKSELVDTEADISLFKTGSVNRLNDARLAEGIFKKLGI